eukprot:Phypoly_transcript_24602.p1 GENE.Phypoly_transcript_24602~~Phypoly_transcript_24602.p1  ORF type:complete len:104 (-),score=9.29 Phypoly_transcript_24602:118-429(-)
MSVVEIRDDTPGSEHDALNALVLSLVTMGKDKVTVNNIKQLLLAHPTFKNCPVEVIIVKDTSTSATNGPMSFMGDNVELSDESHANIQRVPGLGDIMIVYRHH